jgi:omega-6 fatty acid desaturase (delta-12 desaturase)
MLILPVPLPGALPPLDMNPSTWNHGASAGSSLRSAIASFESPLPAHSIWQLVSSIGLYLAAWAAMFELIHISVPLVLLLAIPTGALLVRIFILQHDCGHGSLFASRAANNVVGTVCGLLTLTPYANWRRHHAGHHGVWNNLDRRQSGADIYSTCLTVKEYRALPWRERFVYRTMRHPLVAHVILPPLVFVLLYRVPFDTPKEWKRERRSVHVTNVLLAGALLGLGLLLGFWQVLVVQAFIIVVASIIGVWLFALQHRFDNSHWARQKEWSFSSASLDGSSCLRLPRVMQWFTGNIGFHHIHHLAPRVPNYRLQACYEAIPALRARAQLTLWAGLRSVWLSLWDEDAERMVGFSHRRRAGGGRFSIEESA